MSAEYKYQYRLYDLIINTDLSFSILEAPLGAGEEEFGQVVIRASKGHEAANKVAWVRENPDEKSINRGFVTIGAKESFIENDTCFLYVTDGNSIVYELKDGGREDYLRTYILGWGISLLELQRNRLAVHCSVVANEAGAVIISGESGMGKSTVTAGLLESGMSFMADDMAMAEHVDNYTRVWPAFPYQKLTRSAAIAKGIDLNEAEYIDEDKDKFRVRYKGPFELNPKTAKLMIILAGTDADHVEVNEVPPLSRMMGIAGNLFLRAMLGRDVLRPEYGVLCLKYASDVPMYVVARPEGKDTTAEVLAEVKRLIEEKCR